MKVKSLISVVLVLTFLLAACAPRAAATQRSTAPKAIPPAVKPTSAPTKSAETSPTANANANVTATPGSAAASTPSTPAPAAGSTSATPTVGPALINDISVHDQSVKSGTVLIDLVDSLKPGWVAIFTDNNGQPGTVLGYTAVPAGTSSDIAVKIDASKATSKMLAVLLEDAGTIGTFEYPGADQPVKNTNVNTAVMASFNRVGASS
jgi:cytoskeletal protein RodZ